MKLTKKNLKKVKRGDKVKCIIPKSIAPSLGVDYETFEHMKGIVLHGRVSTLYGDGDLEVILDVPKSIETYRTAIYYLASYCSEGNIFQ